MAEHVPVLEFIHELRSAGLEVDYWDVLAHPTEYWSRLPTDRRALFLARLNLEVEHELVGPVTIVKRRGRAPEHDNVFVRLDVKGKEDFSASVTRAFDSLRFQPLEMARPDGVEDAFIAAAATPRPAGAAGRGRTILGLVDEVWGKDPYSVHGSGDFVAFDLPPNTREVERYWVEEPFCQIVIVEDEERQLTLGVVEPRLTEMEKALLATLNERLRDVLVLDSEAEASDRPVHLVTTALELLRAYRFRLDRKSAYKICYYLVRNYLGFGRMEGLMRDARIEDISCNGPHIPIYVVHSRHQNLRTNLLFDELELNSFVIKMAQRGGKLLSVAQPMVDATLQDGSRIQASLGREVTSRGSAFTIRKFREDPLTAVDLVRGGTHTLDTMAFLWLAVELKRSIVVMGATASGKTTTLNCLSQFIPPALKVVTIEDTREMMLQHENWLAAVTRDSFTGNESEKITMYELLRAALRQRPEYIIVGEIRGQEGLTLFQAMSTGHTCYSTMHAGSVESAVYRLENAPISVPRVMLTSLDFFLLQGQVDLNGRLARRMQSLTEVNGLDSSTMSLRMNEVFHWESATDSHSTVTTSYVVDQARAKRGWTRSQLAEEISTRRAVLERLVEKNDRHYRSVAKAVRAYYNEREEARRESAERLAKQASAEIQVKPAREG